LVLFENLRLFFLADEEDTLLLEDEADVWDDTGGMILTMRAYVIFESVPSS
jgi:hypothetical protein